MNWQLKSIAVFLVSWNVAASLAIHLIPDKSWAITAFGIFAYVYGVNEHRIEAYFRGQ